MTPKESNKTILSLVSDRIAYWLNYWRWHCWNCDREIEDGQGDRCPECGVNKEVSWER
jgi:rRNA maturation endonuclease Nob1